MLETPSRPLRRRLILAGLLLSLSPTLLPAAADAFDRTDAQAVLSAADAVRNPPGSFAVRNELTEFRRGRQVDATVVTVFARPAREGGQYDNLVRFDAPARDAGKLMLRNGMDLWFHDPGTRASVRISPQQRLLGQASNGDVMNTRLAEDYRAELVGRETVEDGERQPREAIHLALTAQRSDVPYPIVAYWVDAVDARPILARYYSAESRLLKTAYFRSYRKVLGRDRPTETVIIDGLDPGWVTLMRTSEHRLRDIPESWMQRDYLPRFREE
ncbi:MAG: outer membrane lipoprotein-sorting protein [Rhodocyclaceae bacterium]